MIRHSCIRRSNFLIRFFLNFHYVDPKRELCVEKISKIFLEINIDFHFSQSSLEFHSNFNIHSHFNFQFEMLKCLMKGKWIFGVFHSFSLLRFSKRIFGFPFSLSTIATLVTYEVEEKTIMFQFQF